MPVPKFRTSASKRNMRRSHDALKRPSLSTCPNCEEIKRPHIACGACGFYDSKQVFTPKAAAKWSENDFGETEAPK